MLKSKEAIASALRRVDPEAYVCSLFANDPWATQTINLFDREVAAVKDSVRGNLNLGKIKLAWWRDALDKTFGDARTAAARSVDVERHPVLFSLKAFSKTLHKAHLVELINARERMDFEAREDREKGWVFDSHVEADEHAMRGVLPRLLALHEVSFDSKFDPFAFENAARLIQRCNALRGLGYFLSQNGEIRIPRDCVKELTRSEVANVLRAKIAGEDAVEIPKLKSSIKSFVETHVEPLIVHHHHDSALYGDVVVAERYLSELRERDFDALNPQLLNIANDRRLQLLWRCFKKRYF